MKIFITGFQRTGTTLMEALLEAHPEMEKVFHETALLVQHTRAQLFRFVKRVPVTILRAPKRGNYTKLMKINFSLEEDNWGEKIPYFFPILYRHNWKRPFFQYCEKWNRYFKSEARIVHMVRHPYDTIMSNYMTYNIPLDKVIYFYKASIFINLIRFSKMGNVIHVKFEDLTRSPEEEIYKICSFCNLSYTTEIMKGIRENLSKREIKKVLRPEIDPSRAFNYMTNEKNIEFIKRIRRKCKRIGYDKLINRLNELGGVKYKL